MTADIICHSICTLLLFIRDFRINFAPPIRETDCSKPGSSSLQIIPGLLLELAIIVQRPSSGQLERLPRAALPEVGIQQGATHNSAS
jgi:hypothetical protein